ncbi:M4 family metallopeptidase [Streptomyces jumonjinensis]|uniref:M4 family metallopeptidase n=1 Tax=Streptomyces jumonjinensis TaxID=1945 RepID=UPI002B213E74|nr:M4 family metallopeptidase [Streptomyces jumonjinensis]
MTGLREPAPAAASAADAALGHLAQHRDRYRIADPVRDLDPLRTLTTPGGQEAVRLAQEHRGVPVLGGQYIVRMESRNGRRTITGTSGRYMTGLRVDTTPKVTRETAVERAVDAVDEDLTRNTLTAPPEEDAPPLTGTVRGLVVLPQGIGVLSWHVTVRGSDPAQAEPVLREVYIEARAGYPVLGYSGVKTVGTPDRPAAPARTAPRPAAGRGTAAQALEPGSGVTLDGRTVPLNVSFLGDSYRLRDATRLEEYGQTLTIWDARNVQASDAVGVWPKGLDVFRSPTPEFGADATGAGAVDAHWATARVHDWYREEHGRNGLDNREMSVTSLVGVTDYGGRAYVNAFWDGQKLVYGAGDEEYRPMAAAVDVVGHQMTHAVIDHSAGLVHAGQSGALSEAIADYFGNTIEAEVHGTPADDPDSGLIGEALCRTKTPRECAFRDMNDGRTTSGSFVGVTIGTDNGGVHLNSTIFGGALWDIREDLGADLTDRIVYRALTQYLTPLDGFTEGRAALLAAARDLGATTRQLSDVRRAFSAHGIVPGWENALGVDADPVLKRVNTANSVMGSGGGWWVTSTSNESGDEPYSVWTRRLDGRGQPKLMSPNDGRHHVNPATDGKTVIWQAFDAWIVSVLARPIAGGPVKTLYTGRRISSPMTVAGDLVAFPHSPRAAASQVSYLRQSDPEKRVIFGGGRFHAAHFPSLSQGRLIYQEVDQVPGTPPFRRFEYRTRMFDPATGENRVLRMVSSPGVALGQTASSATHVFWLASEDYNDNGETALRRIALDGSGTAVLSPETGPGALAMETLALSDQVVTAGTRSRRSATPGSNASLPKLWQLPAYADPPAQGSTAVRVSCNRGEQLHPVAGKGRQVLWLDGTTGTTDVVTRARPSGTCG